MTSPVTIGPATLYQGDCLEIMPRLAEVDHVISDPPYEDELHKAVGRIKRNDGARTKKDIDFAGINRTRAEVARAVVEASKGWVLLFSLAEGVRAWRDDLQSAKAKWDTTLAWIKPDARPRFNGQGAARGFECIVTCWAGKGYRSWNGGGRRGVFTHHVNTSRYGGHPTEKPLGLMLELVELYTNPGETVLDPFMGSGTTGVACLKLGRRFVGIEQNQTYFHLAKKRIFEAHQQPRLFVAEPKPTQTKLDLDAGA